MARWLTRNDHDAEDVVQEAYVRAWKCFGSFHGEKSRPWLLTIVRHTCYTWLQQHRAHDLTTVFDEEIHRVASESANPETLLLHRANQQMPRDALEALPVALREIVVLRALEGVSYTEMAAMTEVPLGTVMSRLARARKRLQQCLAARASGARRCTVTRDKTCSTGSSTMHGTWSAAWRLNGTCRMGARPGNMCLDTFGIARRNAGP